MLDSIFIRDNFGHCTAFPSEIPHYFLYSITDRSYQIMPVIFSEFFNQTLGFFTLILTAFKHDHEVFVLLRSSSNWHNGQAYVFGKHVNVCITIMVSREARKMRSHCGLYSTMTSSHRAPGLHRFGVANSARLVLRYLVGLAASIQSPNPSRPQACVDRMK